jgi:hypothetical protein
MNEYTLMRLLGERAEVAPMVERMCAFVASWPMLCVASPGSPAAPQAPVDALVYHAGIALTAVHHLKGVLRRHC